MTPTEAVQETLAGEHAAVYVYGLLGARASYSQEPELWTRVRDGYTTHRARRDQLVAMIRADGEEPVAAAVSYQVPTPARTPAQITEAARLVEERCGALYADMVMGTARAGRQWAIDALVDAAVRALAFGGTPAPFPGLPDL